MLCSHLRQNKAPVLDAMKKLLKYSVILQELMWRQGWTVFTMRLSAEKRDFYG